MEKRDNWIKEALHKEVEFSKSSIPDEWILELKRIPNGNVRLTWKEISWMAASIALLVTLNFSMLKSESSNESSTTEQVYDTYFSQSNTLNQ